MIFTLRRCITPYLSQFSFSLTEAHNVGKKRIFPAKKKKKMLLLEWVMCTCLAALEGRTCEISVLWVVIIQGVQNPPCMGKGTQGYTLLMHNSSKNEEQISLYKRWAGITYFLSFLADACTWKGKALVFYFRRKKKISSTLASASPFVFQYLHSFVLAIFLEPENKLCEERGYDQADVFIMS